MDKFINEQFKSALLDRATDPQFDIDKWNHQADATKSQIRRELKNQIVKDLAHFNVVKEEIDLFMQKHTERLSMYQKLSKVLCAGVSTYVLKMIKKYIDSYLEIYELRKLVETGDAESAGFKTYTDVSKHYRTVAQHDNYEQLQNISNHIGSALQNSDYYKEHIKKLLDPIAKIIESDDTDDINILIELSAVL